MISVIYFELFQEDLKSLPISNNKIKRMEYTDEISLKNNEKLKKLIFSVEKEKTFIHEINTNINYNNNNFN